MGRVSFAVSFVCAVVALPLGAQAQGWVWRDNGIVEAPQRPTAPRGYRETSPTPFWDSPGRPYAAPSAPASIQLPPPGQGELRDGGPRPVIAPVVPPTVQFTARYAAGSIVIVTDERRLYYVLPGNRAYAYQISVGREGFDWYGTETVSRKQEWPDWHPPAEMRQRDPSLPEKMTGGLKNPLGAMALYLGKTLYRIHGTNDERSLGQAQSSGCFRMMNGFVMHLASITEVGTTVHVVKSIGGPAIGRLDPPPTAAPAPPPPVSRQAQAPQRPRGYDESWERQPPPTTYYRQRRGVWDW